MGLGWPDEAVERARARVGSALFGARANVRPIVGRFEVEGPLGFSSRLRGRDRVSGAPVMLHFRDASDPGTRACAALRHPNVIPVRETVEHGSSAMLVSDCVRAEPLRAWVERRPRFLHELVLAHLDAARGLEVAHAVGLAHPRFTSDRALRDRNGAVRVHAAELVSARDADAFRRDVVAVCAALRGSLLLTAASGAAEQRVHALLDRWEHGAPAHAGALTELRAAVLHAL